MAPRGGYQHGSNRSSQQGARLEERGQVQHDKVVVVVIIIIIGCRPPLGA
jgi:hypothetical protein